MPGDADISAEQSTLTLEGPQTDFPLFAPPPQPSIASTTPPACTGATVDAAGTLQLGIRIVRRRGGAVADRAPPLQPRLPHVPEMAGLPAGRAPVGLRQEAPFEAGLHGVSEMFVEGFLDLMQAGDRERRVDGALLNAAFFVGSRAFYRTLREMPPAELAKLRMTSVVTSTSFTATRPPSGGRELKRASSTPRCWQPCPAPWCRTGWKTARR